jgi:hypothetical protein
MNQIKLKFENDDFGKAAMIRTVKADNAYHALNNIVELLRTKAKYEELTPEQSNMVEHLREEIHILIEDSGIHLEEEWR